MHHYYYDLYAFVKNCAVPIDIITLVYANHGRSGSGIGMYDF